MMGNTSKVILAARAVSVVLLASLFAAAPPRYSEGAAQVSVRLTEWKIELQRSELAAGPVTFVVTNAGTMPHGFEVEGQGIEKRVATVQPGASATLTVTLAPGSYEVYCPVGSGAHKQLGMEGSLTVAAAQSSGSPGYNPGYAPPQLTESAPRSGAGSAVQVGGGAAPTAAAASPQSLVR